MLSYETSDTCIVVKCFSFTVGCIFILNIRIYCDVSCVVNVSKCYLSSVCLTDNATDRALGALAVYGDVNVNDNVLDYCTLVSSTVLDKTCYVVGKVCSSCNATLNVEVFESECDRSG